MIWGSRREPYNRLASAITDSSTTLTLKHVPDPHHNYYIGIGPEIMFVADTDDSTKTLTVERGDDTPAVAHDADTRVELGWRFFTADLLAYFRDEVASWPDTIFAVGSENVTIGIQSRDVDLPLTRFRFPLALKARRSATIVSYPYTWVDVPRIKFRIEQNLPTSEFPSGNALIVPKHADATDYRLEYAQSFDLAGISDLTTDIADIGLTETMIDAVMYGIGWRALSGDEAARSDTASQPEPREAEEVEAGDRARLATLWKEIRAERLADEARRLRQTYRVRF